MLETTVKHKPNHLINEKSPYLLQHIHNPVDWYPWGEEAFARAAREDKPIFLSIGYSTCHWCHVMAEESFEDREVAEFLNSNFISIKVDREERPDIDNIYMTVCQLMTGHGGWPLSIFMTADKKPFFAGTYIPRLSRYGRTGMLDLLPRINELWQNRRGEVIASAARITGALRESGTAARDENAGLGAGLEIPESAYRELKRTYDKKYGGFDGAPKFPIPHQLLFLLHYWKKTGEEEAREMVERTLLALRSGGIYDQLGYGFHRYSTDREWVVPHFEKMLYDQALLAYTYLEAYQAGGKKLYARTAEEIFHYILKEMTDSEGGFSSAEDADSEGEEGLFYVWESEEIRRLLPDVRAEEFLEAYHISPAGNFSPEGSSEKGSLNILYLTGPGKEAQPDISTEELAGELMREISAFENEREALFKEREKRVHPGKDDKILTDWNGLLIAALARGAFILNNSKYLNAAEKAAEFIFKKSYYQGRLYHRYRDGESAVAANLDDYAFLCWGLIELYQASFKTRYLEKAVELIDHIVADFQDREGGGFFFTGTEAEKLPARRKEIYDGALPSGNSVTLWNLVRLSHLTGEQELLEEAEDLVRAFVGKIKENPSAYTMFLMGLLSLNGPFYDLVITAADREEAEGLFGVIREGYYPDLACLFLPGGEEEADEVINLLSFLKDYKPVEGKPTAYVCKDFNCQLPVTEINKMIELLEE